MSGKLTTHVLDLGQSCPAAKMKIELYSEQAGSVIKTMTTNQDGRLDQPLLNNQEVRSGHYELRFYVEDYYKNLDRTAAETSIWDIVSLRFHIKDQDQHYHIPLLISPGGYSTYRGS